MEKLRKKVAMVTGATGMLGSRLVVDLLQNGYAVKAIVRNSSRIHQFKKNIDYYRTEITLPFEKIEWIEADILDYEAIREAFRNVDIVFHAAAMVSFHKSDFNTLIENNVNGTTNVVNACLELGIKQLCHVSSVAALGKPSNNQPITEQTEWVPGQKKHGYSISKFHSELEVRRGIEEGLEAVIVNPSVILGAGEWSSGSPAFFSTIAKGLKFFTRGGTGFVDVIDVSNAMIQLTKDENWEKVKNNRYLISAENRGYHDIFSKIAAALKVKTPSICAGETLLSIAWISAYIVGKITARKPVITRESVSGSTEQTFYDGTYISTHIPFTYSGIDEAIERIAASYQSR